VLDVTDITQAARPPNARFAQGSAGLDSPRQGGRGQGRSAKTVVMAGLDPAIYLKARLSSKGDGCPGQARA